VALLFATWAHAATTVSAIQVGPGSSVQQFARLEVTFQVSGTPATRWQWPYDPAPPPGVPAGVGISVNGVFTDPTGRQHLQPAFYSQQFLDEVREGRDWHLPTPAFRWAVRFAPHVAGNWTFKIVATDSSGTVESASYAFTVVPSSSKGFLRVSRGDPRYFEFDGGQPFYGLGFELPAFLDNPTTRGEPEYAALAANGVDFVRVWISSIFGSAWSTWIGGRNQYRGYLPFTGLTPIADPATGEQVLAMRLDYEPAGDTDWFDACRMQLWWEDQAESIEPNKTYRIRVEYRGEGIVGPRNAGFSRYGLVAKLGGWHPDCYQPGTSTVVTGYGGDNTGFGFIEGDWNSGSQNFLPRMYLALENVQQGAAWVRSVSLRERLGNGDFGPELMRQPSMEHHLYIPEEKAYALDKVVQAAERHGVHLKLVVMEKDDKIYFKMADDGSWASPDNQEGFYGLGRAVNKTRWLQQMWWRYLQARWGYSTAIHSWELANEASPFLPKHFEMADEFGKFMHCRVFGVEPGAGAGAKCPLDHPNDHMVTTSLWQWFPTEFWGNASYPNVDYADVHAYVSTSYAPLNERQAMQWDAAHFHAWHSQDVASHRVGKPVVRGEAGLDSTSEQNENVLGLARDTGGVWLHNYLWSTLDSGGLYELYWWNVHIWGTGYDHRPRYLALRRFLEGIALNRGGYVDWGGTVSNPALRVVGQKDTAAGGLHLWVQNRQHTWKNVVDGVAVAAVSGEVTVPGFRPGTTYELERWDTSEPGRVASTQPVVTDASGNVRVSISGLATDVAFKIRPRPTAPSGVRVVQ
jgi:hypothetical protein